MLDNIKKKAGEIKGDIAAWRHHFHSHPELSYQETETATRIASILRDMGYDDVKVGCKGRDICVVADLDTGRPGKCIALRADIDALAVQEERDVPYRSKNDGVMHACGHDAHASMLLGAARILKDIEPELKGKVRLIFQHAEERGGGARELVEEGVLDGVDAVFGQHIWSPVPSGSISYCYGPTMASADQFELRIQGRGGHGSMPHLSIDPVVAACSVVSAWQTIVSREVDPLDAAVISVGEIKSGSVFNAIPDSATIKGTTRTFDPAVRELLAKRMEETAVAICSGLRCQAEFEYKFMLSPTITDPEFTRFAVEVAKKVLGEDKVVEARPTMGAEDFSYYLQERPGTFMFLGTGNEEKDMTYPQHHPKYCVDDDVLDLGAAMSASIAWSYLKEGE
ncbi:amidohydrolase [Dethiosulfovibrio peptidovorans DSM 11002]|uniref:Amidohydrolase n=1 Tax=Dethiosulfovibrio peptidovorans DSM 11002 TaxID=469381 RepID=D2Z502_9BACT|nr:amidohydrolase [Dethiosulfovibrio peptidovorans]EFC90561.1 amidohydrolase [Dethiosulfovibrio peptidovorans DSM 11002]